MSIPVMNHFELTPREKETLTWIAQGKSDREIGKILSISPRTVGKHLERIYQKLDVNNRTAAAIVVLSQNLAPEIRRRNQDSKII